MSAYELFQIRIEKHEIDLINQRSPKTAELYEAHLDALVNGACEKGLAIKRYLKVATIQASNLDQVFDIANIGPESQITRHLRMHSASVGDLIRTPEGEIHVVMPIGFRKISSDALDYLTETSASQTL